MPAEATPASDKALRQVVATTSLQPAAHWWTIFHGGQGSAGMFSVIPPR